MKPWLEKLARIAPAVAGAALNPATAPAAIANIVRTLALPSSADDAVEAAITSATPEQIIALKQLDVQVMLGQAQVNQAEASSNDAFSRRWRPAVGWVCVVALGYCFLLQPLLAWGTLLAGAGPDATPPKLDVGDLLTLLTGMLGIGAMRSFDKLKT